MLILKKYLHDKIIPITIFFDMVIPWTIMISLISCPPLKSSLNALVRRGIKYPAFMPFNAVFTLKLYYLKLDVQLLYLCQCLFDRPIA